MKEYEILSTMSHTKANLSSSLKPFASKVKSLDTLKKEANEHLFKIIKISLIALALLIGFEYLVWSVLGGGYQTYLIVFLVYLIFNFAVVYKSHKKQLKEQQWISVSHYVDIQKVCHQYKELQPLLKYVLDLDGEACSLPICRGFIAIYNYRVIMAAAPLAKSLSAKDD